ncbi:MAG: hypothetical protein WBV82_03445 [Myxococcaceae bacterium]
MRSIVFSILLALAYGCGDATSALDTRSVTADSGRPGTDAGPSGSDGGSDAGSSGRDGGSGTDAGMAMADAGSTGSVGCVSGRGIDEGENTFMLEGLERRYRVYLPATYRRDRPWPVILALHPNGGNTGYWNNTSGDRNIRGEAGDSAILVIAEAIDGEWRDYGMPASTWPSRIETELAYFDTIVDRLKTELCVNENQIFAMGFSGGGSFSGVLGCRREYIRAIAVGGSVIYFDEVDCVSTPASWITIGSGELEAGRVDFRDFFRSAAKCDETSAATDPAPCVSYDGCNAATPVHYCQHSGGHQWPAFGTTAAWQFFQTFIE